MLKSSLLMISFELPNPSALFLHIQQASNSVSTFWESAIAFLKISPFVYPVLVIFAVISAAFLFWRACRHELIDSSEAFDLLAIATLGAMFFSRIFDFVFRNSEQVWSVSRLVFFNRYGSFDFWGGLLGLLIAIAIFTRNKKTSLWFILDLFVAPLVFAQAIIAFANFETYYFAGYALIFIVLKRLAVKKRHDGFFSFFYLICVSVLSLLLFKFETKINYFHNVPYTLAAPAVFLAIGAVSWYLLAKRKIGQDIGNLLGFLLLSIFRTKRMLVSANEAGTFSKSIIFTPYYLIRMMLAIFVTIGKEFKAAIFELLYVFGLRRFSK